MGKRKRDRKPLMVLKAVMTSLPLLLKLFLVFLKYKRTTKKRKKIFRETLKKEGLEGDVAEKLSDDLPELSIRDLISDREGSFNF